MSNTDNMRARNAAARRFALGVAEAGGAGRRRALQRRNAAGGAA